MRRGMGTLVIQFTRSELELLFSRSSIAARTTNMDRTNARQLKRELLGFLRSCASVECVIHDHEGGSGSGARARSEGYSSSSSEKRRRFSASVVPVAARSCVRVHVFFLLCSRSSCWCRPNNQVKHRANRPRSSAGSLMPARGSTHRARRE